MLASTAAYLLVDDKTLVAWIAKGAGSVAGINISYLEPVKLTRTLSPTLDVSDLSVANPEHGYSVHTSFLKVQISLPRLVLGQLNISRLWLGDTRVELSDPATPSKKAIAPSNNDQRDFPAMPALHDVRVAELQIVSGQREMLLPTVDFNEMALALERDTDTLQLMAQVDLAGESVEIEARVPQFYDGFNARILNFSVSTHSAVASLLLDGQLDFAGPDLRVDGNLSAQASDLKQLPIGIQGLKAPGTLVAKAQFSGTIDQFAVSDLQLQWQGPEQSSLEVRGSIEDVNDFAGIALEVTGQFGESPWLTAILPDTVGTLKHAELSAQIVGMGPQLQIRELNFAARDSNGLNVSLDGKLDLEATQNYAETENIDIKLAFSAPTTRAARILLFDAIPEFGAIEGSADIRSETGPPSFENIVVLARDSAGIEVELNGRIAKFPLNSAPNRGYDLDVAMQALQASLMGKRLGLDLPLVGPAAASFRIEGDTKALRLERIKATVGNKQALRLRARGQVHFRDWDLEDPLQSINLSLQLKSHNTSALARLLGTELPELGAFNAKARLHTVSNQHRITNFVLQTVASAPLSISLSGAASHLVLLPELAVEDIALVVSASTADVTRLNALLGWQDTIPAIGAARARAKLSGNNQKLSVSNVTITAGKPSILLIEASGRVDTVAADNDWQPQNVDLSVRASATRSKALAKLLGYPVPELGQFAASARIHDQDRKLGLETGRLVIGDTRAPVVEAEGYVDDLFGAGSTRWDVKLDVNRHRLAAFAGLPKLSDLGGLRGKLQISNRDGSLGIDTLSLNNVGPEPLKLKVSGRYGDFSRPESLSLTGRLKAPDMQTVGTLFDLDWPTVGPVTFDTRISKSGEYTAFDTRMVADRFVLDADLRAVLAAEPPRLSGKIRARNAFVPRLAEQAAEDIKQKRESKGPFFSQEPIAFDWLKKVDLDLSLDVESFDPELARAQSAQAQITLKSGRLAVNPVIIKYQKGRLDLDLRVEAQRRPRISIKAYGKNLDALQSLYMEEAKTHMDAVLDVDIELEFSGDSAHRLAASAQGDVFVVFKNGFLRRDLIELVFADIIGWVWQKTRRNTHYPFSCGVADYHIDQGVVTTEAFLLDSEDIAISGDGTIDLGKEQVDYVVLPRKKSRIISRADPVKITGALNDPSVKVIPWKSAVSTYGTYGTLLFAPYIFAGVTALGFLRGIFDKHTQESPCLVYKQQRTAERKKKP